MFYKCRHCDTKLTSYELPGTYSKIIELQCHKCNNNNKFMLLSNFLKHKFF